MRGGAVSGAVAGAVLVGAVWFAFGRNAANPTSQPPSSAVARVESAVPATAVRAALQRAYAEPEPAAQRPSEPYVEPTPPEPPPQLDAAGERSEHTTRLEQSGPAPGEYLLALRGIERDFAAAAKEAKADMELAAFRCYRAGCYLTATHKEQGTVESLSPRLSETDGFRTWAGGKFRSGPIVNAAGKVEVTWVFFGADDPTTAADPLAQ
jgi:hypothetical protein